jgi:hypothetical protein
MPPGGCVGCQFCLAGAVLCTDRDIVTAPLLRRSAAERFTVRQVFFRDVKLLTGVNRCAHSLRT